MTAGMAWTNNHASATAPLHMHGWGTGWKAVQGVSEIEQRPLGLLLMMCGTLETAPLRMHGWATGLLSMMCDALQTAPLHMHGWATGLPPMMCDTLETGRHTSCTQTLALL